MPPRRSHESHDTVQPAKKRRLAADKQHHRSRPHIPGRARAAGTSPPVLNQSPTTVLDVFVFGNGEAGELGLGPKVTEALRPVLNPFLSTTEDGSATNFEVVQMDCGGMHSIALTRDNLILTWGVNDNGALGRETTWEAPMKDATEDDSDDEALLNPRESTPTAVSAEAFPLGTTFVQVAAGDSCSFALTSTGAVFGWGTFRTPDGKEVFLPEPNQGRSRNKSGGRSYVQRQSTPASIPGLSSITQLAVGANHAFALDSRGRVWAWGCDNQNQLGCRMLDRHWPRDVAEGRLLRVVLEPRCVGFPRGVRIQSIASGEYHALAIDICDRVWAWGLDGFGETGADPTGTVSGRSVEGPKLPSRELRALGSASDLNVEGPLPPSISLPMEVRALANQGVVALAGGGHHSVAITANGRCLAWGRLDAGQLGVALEKNHPAVQTDERDRPQICLLPTVVPLEARSNDRGNGPMPDADHGFCCAIACGTDHTLMATRAASHAAFVAGFNGQGQLGLGAGALEEVMTARQIGGKLLRGRTLTWAGAGGQFSMLAGPHLNVV